MYNAYAHAYVYTYVYIRMYTTCAYIYIYIYSVGLGLLFRLHFPSGLAMLRMFCAGHSELLQRFWSRIVLLVIVLCVFVLEWPTSSDRGFTVDKKHRVLGVPLGLGAGWWAGWRAGQRGCEQVGGPPTVNERFGGQMGGWCWPVGGRSAAPPCLLHFCFWFA